MLSCPYQNYYRHTNISYMRLFHASPNAPAVDIYADSRLVAQNLTYKSFTKYISLPAGAYTITIFPAGKKANALLTKKLTVPLGIIFTNAVIGIAPNINILSIAEPAGPVIPNKALVRFSNLSPASPAFDLTYADGSMLFQDVGYKEVTDYMSLPPGSYHLQIREAGTDNILLVNPNIRVGGNKFYTIYAVGLLNEKPPLQMLIPLDGNSYLKL